MSNEDSVLEFEWRCTNRAGQEGFEPTTCGFGDRRSNRWSYWPIEILAFGQAGLFYLFMLRMFPAAVTKLLQRDPVWRIALVLLCRVVPPLAIGASHGHNLSHRHTSNVNTPSPPQPSP